MRLPQEHSLEGQLVLLYGSIVAIGNELAELQRSTGATSYQVGEELEACSHFLLFYRVSRVLPQDNVKKYSRLILLSPSVFHYKGKIPREYLTVRERPR